MFMTNKWNTDNIDELLFLLSFKKGSDERQAALSDIKKMNALDIILLSQRCLAKHGNTSLLIDALQNG